MLSWLGAWSAPAQLAHELFGVTVEPAQNEHTWHPDVRFFSLKKDGQQKAFFYLDPYSRPAGACPSPLMLDFLLASALHFSGILAVPCCPQYVYITHIPEPHCNESCHVMVVSEKRGGAWMDEVVGQSRLLAPPGQALRLPVAHMVRLSLPLLLPLGKSQ